MTIIVQDSLNGPNWHNLTSRTGEVGATWTYHPVDTGLWRFYNNRIYCEVPGAAYASGVPPTADYTVECDYTVLTDSRQISIAGRMNTSIATMYLVFYNAGELVLVRRVSGTNTTLDANVSGLMSPGNTYRLALEMIGSAIKVYVNGVQRISVTDSNITAAGRGGIRSPQSNDAGVGKHIDNFLVYDTGGPVSATKTIFAGFIG